MIEVTANAKINLTLDVTGTRPDGYHEVEMIMQSIGLSDTIRIETQEREISLEVDAPDLPADETNLAWRAADLFLKTYCIKSGVRISVEKRIPIAAGLAGGSTDAAGVIVAMDELFGTRLTIGEMSSLSASIGSDVPFCVEGGTMLASGRGEKLKRLSPIPECWVVVAKPPISISTAWAYREYDSLGSVRHPDTAAAISALGSGDIRGLSGLLRNVLEEVTADRHPVIREYKRILSENGALASLMSGSGPAVFGIAVTREEAERAADAIGASRPEAEVFVVPTATGRKI